MIFNKLHLAILSGTLFFTTQLFSSQVYAESNRFKLGFGFDQGLGVTGSLGDFNLSIGNDGIAGDYLFKKDTFKANIEGSVLWYVGAGAYHEWGGDDETGARLPVGVEWYFAKNLDAYAQLSPTLGVDRNNGKNNDHNEIKFGLDAAIGVRYQF